MAAAQSQLIRPDAVKVFLPLLLMPFAALAQDDLWDDEGWGDEEKVSRWSGFVEAGLGTRFSSDPPH